jgi:hypothetical protein
MTVIEIPFSSKMTSAALAGQKCATTRSERKGDPGDTFEIGGQWFRLIDVQKTYLPHVKLMYYRIEGCESPEDFETVWRSLHRGHYSLTKPYFIHFFARCPA